MIALDTNLLIYAHRPEFPFHERAKAVLRSVAESPVAWAIPFHSLVEFAATVSHARKFLQPSSPVQVRNQIQAWIASPSLCILDDGPVVHQAWLELMTESYVSGPLNHDARLAAICMAHGVTELWTADRDYLRFPGLRSRNPLVA